MNETLNGNSQIETAQKTKFKWSPIFAWSFLAAFLVLIFLSLANSQEKQMKLGEKAPEFVLTTFQGETITSEELLGKVVVLNIWASWCTPCEQEAADLESAWRHYQPRGDIIFLGVAWTDTDKKSFEYLEKYGISYPNGPDLGTKIFQDFRATGVPETFIIDRRGVLRHIKVSPFESPAEILAVVDSVLED